ncbi:MAG: YraN family protein [Eubacteriales bacterium]|nr:YraN family protein [Eubacteriales bacterium]
MDKRVLGQIGENTAADVLRAKGYKILRQNYRCNYGEIDIIAEKSGDMSFVEVKTRQNFRFGRPCEAVSEEKKKHIRRVAGCYLKEMKEKGYIPRSYDFQVMEVVIQQIEHAF